MHQPTAAEIERRRRIKLAIWAYAYEIADHSVVSDAMFDIEASFVDLSIDTGDFILDCWFRAEFSPETGMWIYNHPNLERIKQLYERYYKNGN